MAAVALVPAAVVATSRLVVNDHVDEVVRIVRMHCTRGPEFILRELRNVQTVAVHRVETEGAVRRTIPGIEVEVKVAKSEKKIYFLYFCTGPRDKKAVA